MIPSKHPSAHPAKSANIVESKLIKEDESSIGVQMIVIVILSSALACVIGVLVGQNCVKHTKEEESLQNVRFYAVNQPMVHDVAKPDWTRRESRPSVVTSMPRIYEGELTPDQENSLQNVRVYTSNKPVRHVVATADWKRRESRTDVITSIPRTYEGEPTPSVVTQEPDVVEGGRYAI